MHDVTASFNNDSACSCINALSINSYGAYPPCYLS